MNIYQFVPPFLIERIKIFNIVKESIDNAITNGYNKEDIEEMNEINLAYDLLSCVDELENADYDIVLQAVRWYYGNQG